ISLLSSVAAASCMDVSVLFIAVLYFFYFFFFTDSSTTDIYTLSLHDALPIFLFGCRARSPSNSRTPGRTRPLRFGNSSGSNATRSEEHTSELQSPYDLVCRLLLEKKNNLTEKDNPSKTSHSLYYIP